MLAYQDRLTAALSNNNVVFTHIKTIKNREDGFLVILRVPVDDEEQVRQEFVETVRDFGKTEPITAKTQRIETPEFIYLICLFNQE